MPINARATTYTFGTAGDDTLLADYLLGDLIDGLAGNDVITGLDGDDTLLGGTGRDTLYGMGGNDILDGGAGHDKLYGGAGNDILRPDSGRSGNDLVDGGDGVDVLDYGNASVSRGVRVDLRVSSVQDTVGAGKDVILNIEGVIGTRYADTIHGSFEANQLQGGLGDDKLYGYEGSDLLEGGGGGDTLVGGDGNDFLYGGQGSDALYGDAGNDMMAPDGDGIGNDLIDGGEGIDTVDYVNAALTSGVSVNLNLAVAQQTGGAGMDTLRNVEQINGSHFDDTFIGNGFDNWINGNRGNDNIYGGDGNDNLFAGFGDFGSVNLLDGGNGNDRLVGGSGADTLTGGDGNDRLSGDLGIDTLTGGNGGDLFYFNANNAASSGVDTITDYNRAEDTIVIQSFGFVGPITFIGSAGFSGSGYTEVRVTEANGAQLLEIDLEGNGPLDVDMAIRIIGTPVTEADLQYVTTFQL